LRVGVMAFPKTSPWAQWVSVETIPSHARFMAARVNPTWRHHEHKKFFLSHIQSIFDRYVAINMDHMDLFWESCPSVSAASVWGWKIHSIHSIVVWPRGVSMI
jgi:hypothetical protein